MTEIDPQAYNFSGRNCKKLYFFALLCFIERLHKKPYLLFQASAFVSGGNYIKNCSVSGLVDWIKLDEKKNSCII